MTDRTSETSPGGDVYTMAEAARLKGVSYHTVSRAVRRGKLPAQRLGRMALIAAEDLRDWRPMRERAPHKYRRREPNPEAAPALLDLAAGERVDLANRLSTLYEIVHAAASDSPPADFLGLVADRFASTMGLRRVAIWGFDAQRRAARLASFGPPFSTQPPAMAVSPPDGMASVLGAGEAAVVTDVPEGLGLSADDLLNVNQLVLVPLRVGARQVGVIVGDDNGGHFALSQDQRVLAQALAGLAALAVERSRMGAGDRGGGAGAAAILEQLPAAIVAIDRDGRPMVINGAARDLLGLGGGVTGRGDEIASLGALLRAAGGGDVVSLTRPDGQVVAVALEAREATVNEKAATVMVLRPAVPGADAERPAPAESARR